MKSWTTVVGAGVLALATSASGVLVKFNENFMAASPDRRHGISFMTNDVEPLPHNTLMTMGGYYGPKEGYPCAHSDHKNTSSEVVVLIAISKCLNQSSIDNIKTWIEQVKEKELTYVSEGERQKLKFETTLVPGDCQERTEREKKGQTEQIDWEKKPYNADKPAEALLSNEVLPGEVERISAFAKFGRVLEGLPSTTSAEEIPIAVVSFVNNVKSYEEVEQFEKKTKITQAFNFQICEKGKSCEGKYENCVFLQEDVDLFMYNPFTVVRSFECDSVLPEGVPVSYLDKDGSRKCFCACPAQYELVKGDYGQDRCEPITKDPCICEWDAHPFGYRIENSDNLRKCLFCNIAEKGVPVPFPVDNYVADGRVNRLDASTIAGPHVDLAVTPLFSDVRNEIDLEQIFQRSAPGLFASSGYPPYWKEFVQSVEANRITISELDQSLFRPYLPAVNPRGETKSNRYTWRTFQTLRTKKINELEFTSYGKYELFVDAVDYKESAQCTGCVAIVDKFRPEATTKCPVSFCDNTTSVCDGADEATAELTPDNQEKADAVVKGVYEFADKATNDVCSDARCDEQLYSVKKFFEKSYASCDWSSGEKCFTKDAVVADFLGNENAKKNPLVEYDAYGRPRGPKNEEIPVAEGQCTRCCKASTTLREFWTDYSCGCDFDVRRCSAGSEDAKTKCGAKQCLTMYGDTLAHVSACIKDDIVKESEHVLSKLVQEGQTVTEVHRSISCSDLDARKKQCRYDVKVTDLFDVSAEAKILETQLNTKEYVFWRYKVVGQNNGWRLFTPDSPASMREERFAQAKTKIILEAWTNCGLARRFFFFVHLHVHSEIAVCDYFSDMWYQTSTNRLPITSTVCAYDGSDFAEVTFDYRPFAGLKYNRNELRPDVSGVQCTAQIVGRRAVTILKKDETNPEIIERYAIELLNTRTTNATTTVRMACTFKYVYHDKSVKSKTCRRTITMEDCNKPEYNDADGACLQQCANRNQPGPYEACGGQIISHDATKTTFSNKEKKCCDRCSRAKTTCTAILGLKNEKEDIKRCVPEVSEYANYAYNTEGAYDYVVPYTENEKVEDAQETPVIEDVEGDYNDAEENAGAAGAANAAGAAAAAAGAANAAGAAAAGAANAAGAAAAAAGAANAAGAAAAKPELMLSAAIEQLSSMNASAASLLFASGMVAVLAVVVVRGRRAAAPKPTVAEDAYYPLLH